MTQAKDSQALASTQCNQSRKAQETAIRDGLGMYSELNATLDEKVTNTKYLMDQLQRRADSVQSTLLLMRQSLTQLETAASATDAPLQLCRSHMESRRGRPPREQVRDIVEAALEDEHATHMESHRKLAEASRKTRAMIAELEKRLQELRGNLDHKAQALSLDEMCLRTTGQSFNAVSTRTLGTRSPGRPSWGGHPEHAGLLQSRKNEHIRERQAAFLDRSAAAQEAAAKELLEETGRAAAEGHRASEEAIARSERAMLERMGENEQVRRRLAGELQETEAQIDDTVGTIAETRFHLTHLEEPMELAATCSAWRDRRAHVERIHDPVSTRLQDHHNTVQAARKGLAEHQHYEQKRLHHLQECRVHLMDDIRDKATAFDIDRHCLDTQAVRPHTVPAEFLGLSDQLRPAPAMPAGSPPSPPVQYTVPLAPPSKLAQVSKANLSRKLPGLTQLTLRPQTAAAPWTAR
eukprot:CAMPEP_0168387998 /NCGR_PEP_ID=MMETSP0228-20121227/16229_1 /TAXON_ID=133427 /ORGANISM="Protoceratium reticulatum, Strain CCCM 535 (=CCMP 1889)" /LENGTH=464 /DNA_ID=CAMNT_0008401241 /DNA_START=70 /DNA_END=1464 /DNA_ORIENTATION=-